MCRVTSTEQKRQIQGPAAAKTRFSDQFRPVGWNPICSRLLHCHSLTGQSEAIGTQEVRHRSQTRCVAGELRRDQANMQKFKQLPQSWRGAKQGSA